MEKQSFSFGPYRLDPHTHELRQGKTLLPLSLKARALLQYFLERPGQLVTKDELFAAVWPDTVVSDAALAKRIEELRRAFQDDAKAPRYIKTAHRQGYRFIAPLRPAPPVQGSQLKVQKSPPLPTFVGREVELRKLHDWFTQAQNGRRQIVFVTGEPGIGKTTLLDRFTASLPNLGTLWIGAGQCIQQYGAGEAYLPILDALGRLCREQTRHASINMINLLRQHAPTWLVQMPGVLNSTERLRLQREVQGTSRERMLREMAEALERITAEQPLILILEDLHWSDASTVELLSALARRREPARLLVLASYRPADIAVHQHPLREMITELQLHDYCRQLAVDTLDQTAVETYLTRRFATNAAQAMLHNCADVGADVVALADLVYQRTEGNPLFMVSIVDDLVQQGLFPPQAGTGKGNPSQTTSYLPDTFTLPGNIPNNIPNNLQQLVEQQFDRLSLQEREIIEAASVAGPEFPAASVTAGTGVALETAEAVCDALVERHQLLHTKGVVDWPDGTLSTEYSFRHTLYQEIVYDQISPSRRARLHRQIGAFEETAYGQRAKERAAELAVHFERGQEYARAVHYLSYAGQNAIRRRAPQEAVLHLRRGISMLESLPATPERVQAELQLYTALGIALPATQGLAAPEVGAAYTRAQELCAQVAEPLDAPRRRFWALWGLWGYALTRAEFRTASELARQGVQIAQVENTPALVCLASVNMGISYFYQAELSAAHSHFEQALERYDRETYRMAAYLDDLDPGVTALAYSAWVLWLRGYPTQARLRSQEAIHLAKELQHPHSLALALNFSAWLQPLYQDAQRAWQETQDVMQLSRKRGYPQWQALGTLVSGWALVEQGRAESGLQCLQASLAAYRAIGAAVSLTYALALLAEAQVKGEQFTNALVTVGEALSLAQQHGETYYLAELYRLKGELLLTQEGQEPRAGSQEQGAKSTEHGAKGKGQTALICQAKPKRVFSRL